MQTTPAIFARQKKLDPKQRTLTGFSTKRKSIAKNKEEATPAKQAKVCSIISGLLTSLRGNHAICGSISTIY